MLKLILLIIGSLFILFILLAVYSCFIISGRCSELERQQKDE